MRLMKNVRPTSVNLDVILNCFRLALSKVRLKLALLCNKCTKRLPSLLENEFCAWRY